MSLWDGFSFLWSSQNRASRLYTAPLYISLGPSKLSAPVASPVSLPANCKLGPHFLLFVRSDRSHAKETPFRLFVHFPTSTLAVSYSLRHTQNNSDFWVLCLCCSFCLPASRAGCFLPIQVSDGLSFYSESFLDHPPLTSPHLYPLFSSRTSTKISLSLPLLTDVILLCKTMFVTQ